MARPRRAAGEAGKTKAKTEYHILRALPGADAVPAEGDGDATPATPERWEIAATLSATGEKQAKRAYVGSIPPELFPSAGETLVAVPTRSWNRSNVTIKQRPQISFDDA